MKREYCILELKLLVGDRKRPLERGYEYNDIYYLNVLAAVMRDLDRYINIELSYYQHGIIYLVIDYSTSYNYDVVCSVVSSLATLTYSKASTYYVEHSTSRIYDDPIHRLNFMFTTARRYVNHNFVFDGSSVLSFFERRIDEYYDESDPDHYFGILLRTGDDSSIELQLHDKEDAKSSLCMYIGEVDEQEE